VVTGQAAFEFRMFPTAGGARTIEAGRYAECLASEDPADFWRAVPLLYHLAETGAYTGFAAALAPLADRTAADLEACAAGAEQVNTDTQLGRLLGVQGTPAVLVQYADSDLPEFITLDGTTYNRGAVPLEVLGAVIAAAQ
jgi:protein-disulfide isomerase